MPTDDNVAKLKAELTAGDAEQLAEEAHSESDRAVLAAASALRAAVPIAAAKRTTRSAAAAAPSLHLKEAQQADRGRAAGFPGFRPAGFDEAAAQEEADAAAAAYEASSQPDYDAEVSVPLLPGIQCPARPVDAPS